MKNLRIVKLTVVDSTTIIGNFTDKLSDQISIDNITIESQSINIPNPAILSVQVSNYDLEIKTQNLTPFAPYNLTFKSIPNIKFQSLNGDAILYEDGVTNTQLIMGPIEASNPFREFIIDYLRDNVYSLEDGSLIRKHIDGLADIFSKALFDIRQVKSENYLSVKITDEVKTRSDGPYDRLNTEGAYEILRVSQKLTGATADLTLVTPNVSDLPISLQKNSSYEELTSGIINDLSIFNINSLTINVLKNPVIALTSVVFKYSSGHPDYVYNIQKYGYQLLDSKYDNQFSFNYQLLKDNQIKLNDKILEDSNFSLQNIFKVQVTYDFKNLGRNIDLTTLSVFNLVQVTRETLPPLRTVFNLNQSPIVTNTNETATIGAIVFTDPNTLDTSVKHPAFINEIPFRLEYLPGKPGEYSVDYDTGTVYVYGADLKNDGTGPFPPLASYQFRRVFEELIDYVLNEDLYDIVALPNGNLFDENVSISFKYEQVLIPGIDYKADVHKEILSERINNNLSALNSLKVANTPVTDVFRVFNETSGEVYKTSRWSNDTIYFNYNTPPKINQQLNERVSFENILNETMFVNEVLTISGNLVFKILLNNNKLISTTEDCIGSSINSTVKFYDLDVFTQEVYYDPTATEAVNTNRLVANFTNGTYFINYVDGIIYCRVTNTQNLNVGTVSYKHANIIPTNPHIITVNDLFYRVNILNEKDKKFKYASFDDNSIIPFGLEQSDEQFLLSDGTLPYVILNGKIGSYINSAFVPGVTSTVKAVRGVYDYADLIGNKEPLNFAEESTFIDKIVTVGTITKQEYLVVKNDGTNNYVDLNTNLFYKSPNITIAITVLKADGVTNLWSVPGTVQVGSPARLIFDSGAFTTAGDPVLATYSYTINNNSHIVIDYNKGEYYIDYTYLADEIIVSYEYGDNLLDFRESNTLNVGDQYYVSYKIGALRSALLKNFGSLINLPILNTFDTTFNRERYRDALIAALQSFIQGPTISSIKSVVSNITHVDPEIKEAIFDNWSLGSSLLFREDIATTGALELIPAKFGNGVLISQPDQTITFPSSSNLRTEEGTLSMWVMPEWDGIDNNADVLFYVSKNIGELQSNEVFVGPSEYHPPILKDKDNKSYIKLNKNLDIQGIPNRNKDGIYIYYALDATKSFYRWYLSIVNLNPITDTTYIFRIKTPGKIYDAKVSIGSLSGSNTLFTGSDLIVYNLGNPGTLQEITFLADKEYYLFDFGKDINSNRLSLYKDESGYLNFRVYDKNKIMNVIGADVSNWKRGEKHHVAISWNLHTKNQRDELHLFVDGYEVPNILKFGNKFSEFFHEKFRTVDPEEIVGSINRDIVGSNDLTTTIGSNVVSSTINFGLFNIQIGDTIYINEPTFNVNGYSITAISSQHLTLSSTMPASLQANGSFSINKTTFALSTESDIYSNITIGLLHSIVNASDLVTTSGNNLVTSASVNFVTSLIKPGFIIRIASGAFKKHYVITAVATHQLTLTDNMPATTSGTSYYVYDPSKEEEIPGPRAINPDYTLSNNFTNSVSITNGAKTNDIVLIRSFGINFNRVRSTKYLWSNANHILKTKLAPPISLNSVNIYHVIVPNTLLKSTNTTLVSSNFTYNTTTVEAPSETGYGRSLQVHISSGNLDFTTPVVVTIHGNITEALTFNAVGDLTTTGVFTSITSVHITGKIVNSAKTFLTFTVKEAKSITVPQDVSVTNYPVIKYSYQVDVGNKLSCAGSSPIVTDNAGFFSSSLVGNYLHVTSPSPAIGYYKIISVNNTNKSITLDTSLPSFSNGIYEILNTTTFRSGLQNGYFIFENAAVPKQAYNLPSGTYEFDYYTYFHIPWSPISGKCYIGSDMFGNKQLNGVIDELKITSDKLTDVRIGEVSTPGLDSITKDFNGLKPNKKTPTSLMIAHFDGLPFVNDSDVWITASKQFLQSGQSVNNEFNKSIVFTKSALVLDNNGILNTKTEGTIEFWVSPIYDTANDPEYRFYFDAAAMVVENINSSTNATIKLINKIKSINSVKLQIGDKGFDYFAGGKIGNDGKTIILGKPLPHQNTPVTVHYVPSGFNGDRISIYSDPSGFINFLIHANGLDYKVRAPTVWARNTWHRVKATYKINSKNSVDEMHFFIDGYERTNVLFGTGLLYGQPQVLGSSYAGPNNVILSIKLTDSINEIVIGADYNKNNLAYARIDNLRISNISRPGFKYLNELLDVNYNSNNLVAFPVTDDLYTTYLSDFENEIFKADNFAILRNKTSGIFDFSMNIYDSFGIVDNNIKVKEVLETLVKALKPANSRVFLKYI